MEPDTRSWVDIGTTAIPRLLTEKCIGSFLDKFQDRADYRLRWIFHLTRYYVPNFDKDWAANLKQATDLSERFDDVVILGNRKWTSYGRAVWNTLERVENDVFWVEDDKLWHKPFCLKDIVAKDSDIVVFSFPNQTTPPPEPVGFTTGPAFHRIHAAKWWRENYPVDRDRIAERTFSKMFQNSFLRIGVLGWGYWQDIGQEFFLGRCLRSDYRLAPWKPLKLAACRGYIDPDTGQYVKVRR